jgi:hypothetical protein
MTTNLVVAYRASDDSATDENMRWLAYVVLPTGDFWHVRFNGATEEVARSKAVALWTKVNEKWSKLGLNRQEDIEPETNEAWNQPAPDPWATPSGRGAHFVGTVWMKHPVDGLKRVALTEITMYEKNGFVRSGPRSK